MSLFHLLVPGHAYACKRHKGKTIFEMCLLPLTALRAAGHCKGRVDRFSKRLYRIKNGWNAGSFEEFTIDQTWVYILGLAFGSKAIQKFGEGEEKEE